MGTAKVERKLAAILAADVAGYSRLMGANEEGTHVSFMAHLRELIEPKVREHRGRVVKTTGDGFLATFESVLGAVRCAVEVQRGMAERNAAVPEPQRLVFRLGINAGEMMIDGDDIYGDGVNIAARLETMSEPGGICVSARVQEDASGRLDLSFEDLGERQLKNIARPVRLYRVIFDRPEAPAGSAATGTQLPNLCDRPTFAVLPFDNMSGDPEQEYFADGISEDLITAIATWCRFPVISRNSSFVYKGRPFDIKQVGQELGARYVLEGSVRKAGNRVRITAQLIDALSGHHIWAERYDRELGDLFAIQDEITTSIAAAVEPEIMEVEEHRAITRGSFTAYDLVQRGNWHLYKFTPEGMAEAQRLFAAAIEADPNCAPAYTSMAYSKYISAQFGADFEATLQSAFEFARKAVALDEKDARAHMFLAQTSLWLRRHDDAIAEARGAIALNPSLAQAYSVLGYALDCIGEFEEALKTVAHSFRLRPHDRTVGRCIPAMSVAQYQLGTYDAAEETARRAITLMPVYWLGHQMLAACLGQLGRKEEAAQCIEEIRRREPEISRCAYSARLPFRDAVYARHIEEGLAKAGWNG
ncbi:MAG: adenylate/guanylate cyclase domain-containing protein [Rhodoplanes sp.]